MLGESALHESERSRGHHGSDGRDATGLNSRRSVGVTSSILVGIVVSPEIEGIAANACQRQRRQMVSKAQWETEDESS